MSVIRVVVLILGSGFVLMGIYLAYQNAVNGVTPTQNFSQEPVVVSGFEDINELDREPVRIIIPASRINIEVVKSLLVDGYWQVFEDKAGWGMGSGVPGEPGNQVIFAHAREGLFKSLQNSKIGDTVYILAESKKSEMPERTWHEYRVESIFEVYPSQVETIMPTQNEQLTLYTCTGFNDSKRLIVIAKPHTQ